MILDTRPEGDLLDRTPPHSLEAELGLLGALMLDSRYCDEVATILRPEYMHTPRCRFFYEIAQQIHNAGRRVDGPSLIAEAKATGLLERNGGASFVLDIAEAAPMASNAVWFAETIRDKYELRQGIYAATDALAKLNDPSADAKAVIAGTVDKLLAIGEARTATNHQSAAVVAMQSLDGLQERITNRGRLDGVGFAWHEVARLIGRMRPQDLVILAARTSGGKSAIASGIIEHAVGTQGIPTLLITLEMSGTEYLDRMFSSRSGVAGERIRDGEVSDQERKLLVEHASDFADWPLLIDDTPNRTMNDIAAQCRMLKRQGKLRFLVIDHIGLIGGENGRDTEQEKMASISRKLKLLARELDITVLGLVQINRQSEQRGDPRPKLSDIRSSGAIEHNANIVMFIHRPELYATEREEDREFLKGKAELWVLKNRSGRTGMVPLRWNGDTTTFTSAAQEWEIT